MALFEEIKDECGITWSDEITDRKVRNIQVRAQAILDRQAGEPCDYENDGAERQLLLDLCRYLYNKAYEEFKINFSGDINELRLRHEAARAQTAEETDSSADT